MNDTNGGYADEFSGDVNIDGSLTDFGQPVDSGWMAGNAGPVTIGIAGEPVLVQLCPPTGTYALTAKTALASNTYRAWWECTLNDPAGSLLDETVVEGGTDYYSTSNPGHAEATLESVVSLASAGTMTLRCSENGDQTGTNAYYNTHQTARPPASQYPRACR